MASNVGSCAVHPTLSTTTADLNTFVFGQIITLGSFGGTDSFTLSAAGTTGVQTVTAAFVRGTNATAAAIQTALRTATGDTGLTVAGSTDAGPFTVLYSAGPGYKTVLTAPTQTGCTVTVVATDPGRRKTVRVANHDASAALYFNINSTIVPVSAANDLFYVAPGTALSMGLNSDIQTVRVVGNGNVYSVEIT